MTPELIERLELSASESEMGRNLAGTPQTCRAAKARLQSQSARIAELEGLLEPFANLADANMNDPLRKWLTVAHIQNAARASLTKDSTSAPG